jgi:hypothetical protein
MFIVQKNEAQADQLKRLLRKVKVIYGNVPPQMEFLGNIDTEYLEEFLHNALRIARHPNIDPSLFGFLRLHVAYREGYTYCKQFNTQFLLAKGFEQSQLDTAVEDIAAVPFDEKHQRLAAFAMRSIYEGREIDAEDFEALMQMGWSQKDIFDAIAHTGDILKNGRILTAYSKQS